MNKVSVVVFALMLLICPEVGARSAMSISSIATTDTLAAPAQQGSDTRTISGTIISQQDELVPGVTVVARFRSGERRATSDEGGNFRLVVPNEPVTLTFAGKNVTPSERIITPGEATENLQIKIDLAAAGINESVVIVGTALEPGIERRDDTVYKNTLFARDDQILFTLNAGINAGQHEGGGKSLEVRRFGFNLDHGGLNGGLKILVDDVQQNQSTQGHGQGYLGQLKSLSPELVEGVDIINGPFSAQYGDFSGLGVVHIRQRESLLNPLTLRFQGGSFNTFRTFLAYSPTLKNADSFIAYEGSTTDGPFLNPLRYRRDNLTGNYTRRLGDGEALGFKFNAGRNNFFASGQIPLDEVAAGQLDRFGFLDPFNGGRIRTGVFSSYYRKEGAAGNTFKIDGFVSRSLFDLWSNFTNFLDDDLTVFDENGDGFDDDDPTDRPGLIGDEIQQHDSRLQQGANVQYLHPFKLFGGQALLNVGGNFLASQINVGLSRSIERRPLSAVTQAKANVTNLGGYIQQSLNLFDGHVRVEGGLRYDYFRFAADGFNVSRVAGGFDPAFGGTRGTSRFQPKAAISYTPADKVPVTVYFNYGRGIASQDARGVVGGFISDEQGATGSPAPNSPGISSGPPVSTTDFYQLGTSHNTKRISVSTDLFLIDQSNQQVYIADDGSIEFAGPSRTYGGELKFSVALLRHLSVSGGLTRVGNSFFRATNPRVYVDSAPHTVGNGSITLSNLGGFNGSLRYRYISNYRLDGEDATIRASGHDVVDLSVSRRFKRWIELNLNIDNLFNKRYFETQNFYESRTRPGDPVLSRIHATPGYSRGVTTGITFRFGGEK
ncbi:MAG: TonB-dependent receptor [Pyrinomonadaceae bacterium]